MDEGTRLESGRPERVRGFESHPLRRSCVHLFDDSECRADFPKRLLLRVSGEVIPVDQADAMRFDGEP